MRNAFGAEIPGTNIQLPELPGYVKQEKYAADLSACQTGAMAYQKQVKNKGYFMLAGGALGGFILGWLIKRNWY